MLTPSQQQRLQAAANSAVLCEQATGLPAEITVAQWAIESGWGAASPANNCFGIKAYPGCKLQEFPTQEVIAGERKTLSLEFAAFDSLHQCFEKHASLITSGKFYARAWANYTASRDLQALITEMAAIYATDPGYAGKIRSVNSMPAVQAALKSARA